MAIQCDISRGLTKPMPSPTETARAESDVAPFFEMQWRFLYARIVADARSGRNAPSVQTIRLSVTTLMLILDTLWGRRAVRRRRCRFLLRLLLRDVDPRCLDELRQAIRRDAKRGVGRAGRRQYDVKFLQRVVGENS